MIDEIRTLAVDPTVDAVIVTPHWGDENNHAPLTREKALARELVEAGATAILGAHPHVLQPWEKVITRDGREALIVYSLGNFISNQQSDAQRTGLIALLELTKPEGETARLSAAGFVPTFVDMSSGHRVTELKPGAKAFDNSMRLLPAGNRVSAQAFRALPRDCKPSQPMVVASAEAQAVRSSSDAPASDGSLTIPQTDHNERASLDVIPKGPVPVLPMAASSATASDGAGMLPPLYRYAVLDVSGPLPRPAPLDPPDDDRPSARIVATIEQRGTESSRATYRRSLRSRLAHHSG